MAENHASAAARAADADDHQHPVLCRSSFLPAYSDVDDGLETTAMGLLVQLLSARLRVATGRHLAELCRGGYPDWAHRALWLVAEVAMVSADIQEVIRSAVAIRILSHGFMPLWAGVVITVACRACHCRQSDRRTTAGLTATMPPNYGVRKLEGLFAVLIATMALSFAWMFIEIKPNGKDLIIAQEQIRQAVGLVGCVITPHNVFLHSALVQSRKIDPDNEHRFLQRGFMAPKRQAALGMKTERIVSVRSGQKRIRIPFGSNNSRIVRIRIRIRIFSPGYEYEYVIMSGFLNWKLKRWISALITRSFAIVPTIAVAVWFNTSDSALDVLNEWLNVLQSIQIPFALIPLITLVSKEEVMGVFKIGPRTQIATWIIASVPIIANGYLLMDFFSSEMRGVLSGSVICVAVLVYASFLFYLIIRGMKLPNSSI
ncbi:hypothetical protein DAI22_03g252400 [Oryza sativa Japonica Group]|nr:hypothetical protein DAI22_03g252400 [Oryza sativa Japonica Group]